MKKIITCLFLVLSSLTFSQEGPYAKRVSKASVAQKIVHLIDNSTVGAIQTTIGASHIIMYAI